MSKLISLSNLIKRCDSENIYLGKGDPYNRLRYYTKMGWLPFMIRKKNSKNEIEGHYPIWVLDTLKEINTLKKENYDKVEIENRIKKFNDKKKTKEIIIKNYVTRQNIIYTILLFIIVLLLLQIKFFNSDKYLSNIKLSTNSNNEILIFKRGSGIITKGNNIVNVKTQDIPKNSIINITFINDYYPATRYYIEISEDKKSFNLITDKEVKNNVNFNYIITN